MDVLSRLLGIVIAAQHSAPPIPSPSFRTPISIVPSHDGLFPASSSLVGQGYWVFDRSASERTT